MKIYSTVKIRRSSPLGRQAPRTSPPWHRRCNFTAWWICEALQPSTLYSLYLMSAFGSRNRTRYINTRLPALILMRSYYRSLVSSQPKQHRKRHVLQTVIPHLVSCSSSRSRHRAKPACWPGYRPVILSSCITSRFLDAGTHYTSL
jgi:hypothetical protein